MKKTVNKSNIKKSGKQHVIVGNCIAAVSAAETLRQLNPNDNIVIIGDEEVPSYSRCLITYYLGNMITEDHLLSHTKKWYSEREIDLYLSTRVEGVDTKKRVVHAVTKGKKVNIPYDTLLVATGSSPIFLPSFPYDKDGIIGMRDYKDSCMLKSWAKKGKKAIIIGAGFVGLKSAYGLVKHGVKVKIVELLPTVLGRMTDLEASSRVRDRLCQNELIEIELKNSVVATRKHGDGYIATYQNGDEEYADFIVASVGVRANTDFLENTGVEIDRIVSVDDGQRTTVEDIYAAGDCTRHPNSLLGRYLRLESVHNAVEQGKTVALSIVGKPSAYAQVPWFWSDQYDVKLQIVGLTEGYDQFVMRGDPGMRSFAAFYLQDGRLLAVDAINSPREFMLGKKLIAAGARFDVTELRDMEKDFKELATAALEV